MERESYYFLLLLIAFAICIGVFWFQFNNDVATFMIINDTEVQEGHAFKGALIDAYGMSVPNKTITYHKPGYQMGTLVDTQTDENGEFFIEMPNTWKMQVKTITMAISHLQVMTSIKDAHILEM